MANQTTFYTAPQFTHPTYWLYSGDWRCLINKVAESGWTPHRCYPLLAVDTQSALSKDWLKIRNYHLDLIQKTDAELDLENFEDWDPAVETTQAFIERKNKEILWKSYAEVEKWNPLWTIGYLSGAIDTPILWLAQEDCLELAHQIWRCCIEPQFGGSSLQLRALRQLQKVGYRPNWLDRKIKAIEENIQKASESLLASVSSNPPIFVNATVEVSRLIDLQHFLRQQATHGVLIENEY
jgi:hypothetical protein